MQINNIKNKLYYGRSLIHRYKFNINTLVTLFFLFFIVILIIIWVSTYPSNIKCIQILQINV